MRRAVMRTSATISRPSSRTSSAPSLGLGDVVARDVQPEALALEAAAVAEVDLEVELDAVLDACQARMLVIPCR